ncbi:hypothetical protein H0H93_005569, partial [Arthromyces matolae]
FADRASTVYGDTTQQASKSLHSFAAQATNALDNTKDYIYSTWDDNKLRAYLDSKGIELHDNVKESRHHLLGLMYDAYAKISDPVYHAWSDSYL